MAIKTCPQCKIEFRNYRLAAIYCGKTCADYARRVRVTLTCFWCHQAFERERPKANHEKSFCNPACHKAWMNTLVPVKTCPNCNKEFINKKQRTSIFCSMNCWYESKRKAQESNCDACGKSILLAPSKIARHKHFYCSFECRNIGNSGKNNSAWLGGHKKYRGPNWERQSLKCRQRDSFTCQSCFKIETQDDIRFAAHHRTPYRYFLGNWERANRLSNLITLCGSCHTRIENRITRRRNDTIPENCRPLKTHLALIPPL